MKKLYYENPKKYSDKVIFILTLLVCTILTFLFLQVVLKNGLTGDDWQLLFAYKTFDPQPLNKILEEWMIRGPYTTIQFYYIGILERFLGINYQLFGVINICFKVFASITLFLLISKVFKNNILAMTSALIFSIIPSSVGALSYVVKGTEYLSIGFMNLFFLFYYHSIIKNSIWLNLFTSFILFSAIMLSPIRIYPLLGLIPLIELFLLIKYRSIRFFFQSFTRLLILYLPPLFLAVASIYSLSGPSNFLSHVNDLKSGNWYLFSAPLQALGYTFLGNDPLKILEVLLNLLRLPINAPTFVGILLFFFSAGCFIVSVRKKSKLDELFLLFFCPWFALLFLGATWLILGKAFGITESIHWYLIVPSLGASVFIATLIEIFYKLWIRSKSLKYLFLIFTLVTIVAYVSYKDINRYFNNLLSIGTGSKDQSYMQNQVINSLTNNQINLLAYFEGFKEPSLHQYYAVSSNMGYFEYWVLYFKKPSFSGCITYLTDKNELIEAYNGEYFKANGLCAINQYDIRAIKTGYDISDFRAFLLKDKRILNITNQVLAELRSKKL